MQSQRQKRNYLHPTMYLLILIITGEFNSFLSFTSHYVSINSKTTTKQCVKDINLHPTMYLLIHKSI